MSDMFGDEHRAFQDRFETRRLSDRVVELTWQKEISSEARAFIESRDMFFLATVDAAGRPTCSYTGGAPGFVTVVDAGTLAFPSYDGNGMYLSIGNIAATGEVGLLFIDFETPHRLRVQGRATVSDTDPLRERYKEAELIVRVGVSAVFPDCARYVHRYAKQATSRYVPWAACATPTAEWKRIDLLHDALPTRDQERVAGAGGTMTREDYRSKWQRGEG